MDKRKDFEELEFENPVEIRNIEEAPEKKNHWCLITLLVFIVATGYFGFKVLNQSKESANLQKKIEKLQEELSTKEKKLSEISNQLQEIEKTFSKTTKNKKELLNNIVSLEKKLKKQKNTINKLKSKCKNLENELKRLKLENKNLIAEKKKLKKEIDNREKTIEELKIKLKELQNKLTQQSITLKNLKETFSMESNAAKKLISQLIEEQKKNRKLLQENLELKKRVSRLSNKIKTLENIDEGDLVPSSDLLTLAKPLVSPPVKLKTKGLFSKIKGFAVVNALIDEYGTVKNAYFISSNIPEEKIDRGILINKVLTTIKRWKFSPPLYKGKIAVKTWQPVIIPVQSE